MSTQSKFIGESLAAFQGFLFKVYCLSSEDHGLIAFFVLLPCLYFAHSSASQVLGAFHGDVFCSWDSWNWRMWRRSTWVPLLCSLFFSMSSSVLHWKSQIDANPGISALATCCQRAGLFSSFSAGFTRIFVGLLIQSSFYTKNFSYIDFLAGSLGIMFVLEKHLLIQRIASRMGGFPFWDKLNTAISVSLSYFYDTVMLRAASLRDLFVSV